MPRKHGNKCRKRPVRIIVNITEDTFWSNDNEYIIEREIHVREGVTLEIEDKTTVLFRTGKIKPCHCSECETCQYEPIQYPTLIIDSGAAIRAANVLFKAENAVPELTGGLIIAGTYQDGQYPDHPSIVSRSNVPSMKSVLINPRFEFLGNKIDDINALALFNVDGDDEISLVNVTIDKPGDDGLWIYGGDFTIDIVSITGSGASDDLIDLDGNATLTITEHLYLERPAINNLGASLGAGLVEVQGEPYTVNQLNVNPGAELFIVGKLLDEPAVPSGSFAGINVDENVVISVLAAPNTSIKSVV